MNTKTKIPQHCPFSITSPFPSSPSHFAKLKALFNIF